MSSSMSFINALRIAIWEQQSLTGMNVSIIVLHPEFFEKLMQECYETQSLDMRYEPGIRLKFQGINIFRSYDIEVDRIELK